MCQVRTIFPAERGHAIAGHDSANTRRPLPVVFERDGKRFEIEGRHRVAVNESNAHVAAALAGLGIAQKPTSWFADLNNLQIADLMAAFLERKKLD